MGVQYQSGWFGLQNVDLDIFILQFWIQSVRYKTNKHTHMTTNAVVFLDFVNSISRFWFIYLFTVQHLHGHHIDLRSIDSKSSYIQDVGFGIPRIISRHSLCSKNGLEIPHHPNHWLFMDLQVRQSSAQQCWCKWLWNMNSKKIRFSFIFFSWLFPWSSGWLLDICSSLDLPIQPDSSLSQE